MQDEKYHSISCKSTSAQKSFTRELSVESESVNKGNNINLKMNRSIIPISQNNLFSYHKKNKGILTYKIFEGQNTGILFFWSIPFAQNSRKPNEEFISVIT